MHPVCSVCGRPLPGGAPAGSAIPHDLCADCTIDLQFHHEPLRTFLDKLPGAVMAVDAEGRILSANAAAASVVEKDLPTIEGRLGGQVMSCIYADLPEGCGKTVHCTGCTIRKAVDHTRTTGEPHLQTPAYAYVRGPRGTIRTWFLISTERVGKVVLLRIDSGQPESDDAEAMERWLPIARALRSGPGQPRS